jgi:hypothetical protein
MLNLWEREIFLSTNLILKGLKEREKNVYLLYMAVEGAKIGLGCGLKFQSGLGGTWQRWIVQTQQQHLHLQLTRTGHVKRYQLQSYRFMHVFVMLYRCRSSCVKL